jgi:hypothetical protein
MILLHARLGWPHGGSPRCLADATAAAVWESSGLLKADRRSDLRPECSLENPVREQNQGIQKVLRTMFQLRPPATPIKSHIEKVPEVFKESEGYHPSSELVVPANKP